MIQSIKIKQLKYNYSVHFFSLLLFTNKRLANVEGRIDNNNNNGETRVVRELKKCKNRYCSRSRRALLNRDQVGAINIGRCFPHVSRPNSLRRGQHRAEPQAQQQQPREPPDDAP